MTEEVAEVKEKIQIHLLYIGRTTNAKKEIVHHWEDVDLVTNDGRSFNFDKLEGSRMYGGRNLIAGAIPGTIITIDCYKENKGTVLPKSSQIVDSWKNKDDVQEWYVSDRIRTEAIKMARDAKNAIKKKLPLDNLQPFRKAYRKAGGNRQRAQLLAWVIEEIARFN